MIYIEDNIDIYDTESLERLIDDVSEQRRQVINKLVPHKSKVQSALAYRLLKNALKTEFGIYPIPDFSYTRYGKPFLAEYPDIHFNLSHCNKAVVCAVESRPVGIDVEQIRKFDKDLVSYVSSPDEYYAVENADDPSLAFTVLWTKKEALCKLKGTGLLSKEEIRQMLMNYTCKFNTYINTGKGYVVTVAME